MPVFELCCEAHGTEDVFLPHWYSCDPPCPVCGGARQRLMSSFATPFMGSLHKYTDPNRENAHMEGFWAYRKHSSISGQPEPVWLDSMTAVKEYNKAEGLSAPGDVPMNSTISPDGKRIISDGMAGNWNGASLPAAPARLREMISTPADQCSPPPCTAAPSMPEDYGVTVQAVEAPPEVNG